MIEEKIVIDLVVVFVDGFDKIKRIKLVPFQNYGCKFNKALEGVEYDDGSIGNAGERAVVLVIEHDVLWTGGSSGQRHFKVDRDGS